MKYWAQFMATDLAGNLSDVCGSDGVLMLDGRLSQENMRNAADKQAYRLARIHQYEAYRLVKGESFTREYQSIGPFKLRSPLAY